MAPAADFDWGQHLRSIGGGEPPGMVAPHAHHVVFKNGRGARMCAYLDESKAILARHGIDPLLGRENLVWAPNKNHSTAAARAVRAVRDVPERRRRSITDHCRAASRGGQVRRRSRRGRSMDPGSSHRRGLGRTGR